MFRTGLRLPRDCDSPSRVVPAGERDLRDVDALDLAHLETLTRRCRVKTSYLKNLKFYRKKNFLIGFHNFLFMIVKFKKYIKQAIIYCVD